ncbi:hypothetical protein FBULB1_7589 [Fusarium bulbicola]|nr:hypothetical protein FBULB1_7589 [Fusarium bulbicola]
MSQYPRRRTSPLRATANGISMLSVSELNPRFGEPGQRQYITCPENSWAFTDLASAMNIGLEILESPPGRGVLVRLASQLIEIWDVRHEPCFRGGPNQLAEHVNTFLSAIRNDFYTVAIDDLGSPAVLAASDRRLGVWNGDLRSYSPKGHAIILYNHRRVRDMVNASAAVDRIDRGRDSSAARAQRRKMLLRHKHFQFMFATATAHEICHIFLGFISQQGRHGRLATPPSITHLDYGRGQPGDIDGLAQGESGRWVESKLFGGSLEFYQDRDDDDGQPGVLYILDSNEVAHRVRPQSILDFVERDRRFEFPLATTGSGLTRRQRDQQQLYSIGSTQAAPYRADYLLMRARPERMQFFNISRQELDGVPDRPRIVRAVRVA